METKWMFHVALSFKQTLKYRSIIKTNLDWMVFILETICLKKIKDGTYVINLDKYADVGTHWMALFCKRSESVYFDSFGVEHVREEIKEFIGNKSIKANISRIRSNNSIMCGYFSIGFIDFMLASKKLTDFTSLLSPYDSIILSHFKNEWNW